jgi:hypothetical protein
MTRLQLAGLVLGGAAIAAVAVTISRESDPLTEISLRATRPEQTRLWQQAARQGAPEDFERLIGGAPLMRRDVVPVNPQAPATGGMALAPDVVTTLRVIDGPADTWEYSGKAKVTDVTGNGERIVLDAGGRALVVLARVGGKPIGLKPGAAVDLAYRIKPDPLAREHVAGIGTDTGIDLVAAVVTGAAPAVLRVGLPRLAFVARQVGQPLNGSMPVVIEFGQAKATLSTAKPEQVGDVSVRLLLSRARPSSGAGADGSAYGIDLLVWRARGR